MKSSLLNTLLLHVVKIMISLVLQFTAKHYLCMNDIAIMKILHNIVRERLGCSQLDAKNIVISVLECMGYIVEHVLYTNIQ